MLAGSTGVSRVESKLWFCVFFFNFSPAFAHEYKYHALVKISDIAVIIVGSSLVSDLNSVIETNMNIPACMYWKDRASFVVFPSATSLQIEVTAKHRQVNATQAKPQNINVPKLYIFYICRTIEMRREKRVAFISSLQFSG